MGADIGTNQVTEAQAISHAVEAENTERIKKLLGFGVNPLGLQVAAIQARLEALIELVPMPPLVRAQFEAAYEMSMASVLDDAIAAVGQPRLVVPGAEG